MGGSEEQVIVRVGGFIIVVTSELIVFEEHCGVPEVNGVLQLFKRELDIGVAGHVVKEDIKVVFCSCPNKKATVNVSLPEKWLSMVGVQKVIFEFAHYVGIAWCCFGAHAGVTYL